MSDELPDPYAAFFRWCSENSFADVAGPADQMDPKRFNEAIDAYAMTCRTETPLTDAACFTIPSEAREATGKVKDALSLNSSTFRYEAVFAIITEACISYHSRKCESLRLQLEDTRTCLALQETLRKKAEAEVAELCELHNMQLAAIMTASIQNTEDTIKDRIGPGHDYATVAYSDVCQAVNREMRERTRAEKAEAEVEKLQWDLGICSTCGGEIFHHIDEPFYDCQKCGQHGEATVIPKLQKARCELINFQRDVRPLLSHINECEGDGGCRATKALQTFLSKHPELGGKP